MNYDDYFNFNQLVAAEKKLTRIDTINEIIQHLDECIDEETSNGIVKTITALMAVKYHCIELKEKTLATSDSQIAKEQEMKKEK